MTISKTKKKIEQIYSEARTQAENILAQAGEQCAGIRAESVRRAEETYIEKIRAGVKECEERVKSIDEMAKAESERSVERMKQETISGCFTAAVEKISGMPEDRYVEFLVSLASKNSVTGDELIIFNEKDRASVAASVIERSNAALAGDGRDGKLTVCEETGTFAAGLIMRGLNDENDLTVEHLIEQCREDMAPKLEKIIFGLHGTGAAVPHGEE